MKGEVKPPVKDYRIMYETVSERLIEKEKELQAKTEELAKVRGSIDQLIAAVNGNVEAVKSALIQTLALADNCRIEIKSQQAPLHSHEQRK
ncbi:MAG: hypothetical protein AB1753_06915 [Thermoproteota archaeon]